MEREVLSEQFAEQTAEEQYSKSYHVVLSNYDGPLDLLLDLVKREKINIEDIFISNITEQYLTAMEQLDEFDMEQASEFIVMAATLLVKTVRERLGGSTFKSSMAVELPSA